MGYDVSFHPISPEEMQEWYFTPLSWVQQGQEEKVLALAAQNGIEDFYAEKYLDKRDAFMRMMENHGLLEINGT